jgi:DNA-binding transcriptional regulator YiaG
MTPAQQRIADRLNARIKRELRAMSGSGVCRIIKALELGWNAQTVLADRLGVTPRTVRNWVQKGAPPHVAATLRYLRNKRRRNTEHWAIAAARLEYMIQKR